MLNDDVLSTTSCIESWSSVPLEQCPILSHVPLPHEEQYLCKLPCLERWRLQYPEIVYCFVWFLYPLQQNGTLGGCLLLLCTVLVSSLTEWINWGENYCFLWMVPFIQTMILLICPLIRQQNVA